MTFQNIPTSTELSNRVLWADVTKAYAIWLMVFAHANLSNETLKCMIHTFHMPVFFLISGYFDKGQPLSVTLLCKNFRSLIVPYFFYSIIGLSICWISPYLHPELYYGLCDLGDIFKAAIKGMFLMEDKVRPTSFLPLLALWFLPALFICKALWALILIFFKSKYRMLTFVPLFVSFAAYYCHPNYFSIDSAAMGLPFYALGYLAMQYGIIDIIFRNRVMCVCVAFLFTFYIYYWGINNGCVNMDGADPGRSIVMFYVNAIIGSMACISVAKITPSFSALQKVGASTLTILALHPFVVYPCKVISSYCFYADMMNFPVWGSALIACLSCVFIVWLKETLKCKWLKYI